MNKKLKKISFKKEIIAKFDDFEMSQVQGGVVAASLDVPACMSALDYNCDDPPKTPKVPPPGMTAETGDPPPGGHCHP